MLSHGKKISQHWNFNINLQEDPNEWSSRPFGFVNLWDMNLKYFKLLLLRYCYYVCTPPIIDVRTRYSNALPNPSYRWRLLGQEVNSCSDKNKFLIWYGWNFLFSRRLARVFWFTNFFAYTLVYFLVLYQLVKYSKCSLINFLILVKFYFGRQTKLEIFISLRAY